MSKEMLSGLQPEVSSPSLRNLPAFSLALPTAENWTNDTIREAGQVAGEWVCYTSIYHASDSASEFTGCSALILGVPVS